MDTRSEILSRACELYLEEGLEGFSMRELARRVGVTAPALYRHYDGRDEVLAAVVDEAYGLLSRYLQRALTGATPRERFLRAGRAYLDFALEQPRFYRAIYAGPQMLGRQSLPDELAEQACSIGQFWIDRVRECQDEGILDPGLEPGEVARTLWAHAHGLVSLYLQGMVELGEEELREVYMASSGRVLRGMATAAFERDGTRGDWETGSPSRP